MKKILIILGSYFPKPSANGICVKQVVDEFKRQGVEVTILATKSRGLNEIDMIDDVNVHRIKPRWSKKMFEWCSNNTDKKYVHLIRRILLIVNKTKHILTFPTWPLISPIYTYRYYKKAKKLHNINSYDGILSVYTPIDALVAGALIKRRYTDVKLFLYFLDTLSGGVAPKRLSREWLENRGYKWDNLLFNVADTIFIMKSHQQHYSKEKYNKFKDKIKAVDIPLMRKMERSPHKDIVNFDKEELNIVYTGTLLKHIKNPTYIFSIFKGIQEKRYWRFHIFGGGDCDDLIDGYINEKKGIPIFKYGHVKPQIAINAMLDADILINVGSAVDSQIPAKIFEYMATGKPIISFYRRETEPSIPYLKKYPLSLLIKEDWDKIDENTQLVVDFVNRYKDKHISFNEIKDMFQNNTPEPLVKYVLDLLEGEKYDGQ